MAFSADQREVVQVGVAAVFPEFDVVGLAPLGGAAAHDAAGVADGQGDALVVGGESGGSSEREWYAVVVDNDGGQVGVAGDEFGEEAADGAGPVEVERPVRVARLGERFLPAVTVTATTGRGIAARTSVARLGHRFLPGTTTSGCRIAASSDIPSGHSIRMRAVAVAAVRGALRDRTRVDRIRCSATRLLVATVGEQVPQGNDQVHRRPRPARRPTSAAAEVSVEDLI